MGKQKTSCHICGNLMKTPKEEKAPESCTLCSADLVNPSAEKQTHRTVVQHAAGGVSAELVEILLTDKRLIFKVDGMSGSVGGGLIGGAIGGAIAGAVAGARAQKPENFNAVMLEDITSIDERIIGLFKNKVELALHIKDGSVCTFTLSKKEMEKWRPGLSKHVA